MTGQKDKRVPRITLERQGELWPIVPPAIMHDGLARWSVRTSRLDDSMPIGHTHRMLIERINASRLR